jgi:hypothetical protein
MAPGPPPTSRPRSRPSSRTYLVRRLGALVVVALIVYAVVRVVGGLLGDDEAPAEARDNAAVSADVADGDVADGAEGATEAARSAVEGTIAPSTTEATTTTERSGPPTPANPAKVYIVGDSDAGTFGPYLEQLLDATNLTDTELNYKVSSGLSRPDFFDWPAELARAIPEVDPDIVVVTFGGNDAQGLSVESGEFIVGDPTVETEEWTEEYQRRAGEVMDLLLEDDRAVIWVGIPNDDNPEVTARMSVQDQAVRAAAAERDGVVFIDTWNRFSGRDGNWAEFVIDPRDGVGKDVRADDGFHLNETGAEILAIDIAQAVRDALRDMDAEI